MKILIKNGTIVTSSDTRKSDIYIIDDKINLIEPGLTGKDAEKVIDATGCMIFPGGVDPHVHMHLPTPAGFSSDDFLTGSRAALFGGTTTLIDFVTPGKGQSMPDALIQRIDEATDSMTDFAFHVSPVEWRDTTEYEISKCVLEGVSSFKIYMAYKDSIGLDDADILKVMEVVGPAGGIVAVHCETGDEIEKLRNKFHSENHFEPKYHALSRPKEMEASAVKRAIDLAGRADCPLYIVHVSSEEALKIISEAQGRNQKVFAETCPQYLLFDDSMYSDDFKMAAPYIISPPLRKEQDNLALWDAIRNGTVQTIGTDHCPFSYMQKAQGISDFRKIPNGAGGVEHRLELLYTYGVLEKRITLNQMVDLFSTKPSMIFGLYPAKGELLTGSDADLVVWNPVSENTISVKNHKQNCDINIYEGIKTRGKAEYVITGGKVVIEKGKLADSGSRGRFIKR
jgi:dihydropyrimidinase